jgi:hypothetical protein
MGEAGQAAGGYSYSSHCKSCGLNISFHPLLRYFGWEETGHICSFCNNMLLSVSKGQAVK